MVDRKLLIENETGDNEISFTRPRILLTGLRRSGKTSIQRVIFTKMQPSDTQFLESTPHLTLNQFSCGSFINFQVQELPGQLHMFPTLQTLNNLNGNHDQSLTDDDDSTYIMSGGGGYDMERLLKQCHALVYIIDAQDDYSESMARLIIIIQLGRRVNPKIRYEIFIHKVDQLTEEAKIETQRDIHNQVLDRLADNVNGLDSWSNHNPQDILLHFHLTSIYDHSIFEAFSKVIQKLIPQFSHLEHILTYLLSASNIEQAFLFDVQTKICIATDSSPTDMQMYELCCDMIDLLINMSQIYGQPKRSSLPKNQTEEIRHKESIEWSVEPENTQEIVTDHHYAPLIETTDEPAYSVFDSMSSSVIKLLGGRVLYLKEINRHLALICVLREEALTKQAIIDYNVKQLKESILKLFRLNQQT